MLAKSPCSLSRRSSSAYSFLTSFHTSWPPCTLEEPLVLVLEQAVLEALHRRRRGLLPRGLGLGERLVLTAQLRLQVPHEVPAEAGDALLVRGRHVGEQLEVGVEHLVDGWVAGAGAVFGSRCSNRVTARLPTECWSSSTSAGVGWSSSRISAAAPSVLPRGGRGGRVGRESSSADAVELTHGPGASLTRRARSSQSRSRAIASASSAMSTGSPSHSTDTSSTSPCLRPRHRPVRTPSASTAPGRPTDGNSRFLTAASGTSVARSGCAT